MNIMIMNSLFFKEKYSIEMEKIINLEIMYKKNSMESNISEILRRQMVQHIHNLKRTLFIKFLILKIIEEILYKDNIKHNNLTLNYNEINLNFNIYENSIVIDSMIEYSHSFSNFPEFWFRKNSLLKDIVFFIDKLETGLNKEKLIIETKSNIVLMEKLKINSNLEILDLEIKKKRL